MSDDWDGIRTRASEETSALNWRLRPLGHPTGVLDPCRRARCAQTGVYRQKLWMDDVGSVKVSWDRPNCVTAYDHINVKAPDPVRSPKLSTFEPG